MHLLNFQNETRICAAKGGRCGRARRAAVGAPPVRRGGRRGRPHRIRRGAFQQLPARVDRLYYSYLPTLCPSSLDGKGMNDVLGRQLLLSSLVRGIVGDIYFFHLSSLFFLARGLALHDLRSRVFGVLPAQARQVRVYVPESGRRLSAVAS